MSTPDFFSDRPGRILCATAALGMAAPAAMAMVGPGGYVTSFIPIMTCAVTVGSIFSAVLSVERFAGHALMMVLLLPFLAFFYFMALQVAPAAGPVVGLLLMLVAALPLAAAVAAPLWVAGDGKPAAGGHGHPVSTGARA